MSYLLALHYAFIAPALGCEISRGDVCIVNSSAKKEVFQTAGDLIVNVTRYNDPVYSVMIKVSGPCIETKNLLPKRQDVFRFNSDKKYIINIIFPKEVNCRVKIEFLNSSLSQRIYFNAYTNILFKNKNFESVGSLDYSIRFE